jgi:hypothetical protein
MKRSDFLWGGLLIVAGVLLMLENLGMLGTVSDLFWMTAFLLSGLAFLGGYAIDRARWWPLIPGWALLGLAGTIGVERFAPGTSGELSGAAFLCALGLGFWSVFAARRDNWWAIIPGGVLVTLAIITGLQPLFGSENTGGVLFLGFAFTFALIYLLPTPTNRHRWALIPAGIMAVLSLVTFSATTAALDYIWPAGLIVMGLYLLFRTFGMRSVSSDNVETPQIETRTEERYDEPTLPQPH